MSNIQSRAMLVSLSYSKFSPKKTDKQVTKQVIKDNDAADNTGKFVKQILPEEALDSIKKLESEIRTYYYSTTLAWTDEGARILPSKCYMDFTDKMREFTRKFEPLVDAFIDKFDDYIEAQRGNLKGMFKLDDYPDKDTVRKKFKFKTSFLPFPNGADWRVDISEQEMEALNARVAEDIRQAEAGARNQLWQMLAEPLQAMAKSLGNADGKVFDSVVENVVDIVNRIPNLNITGDENLERIRVQVQSDLCHISAKSLRKSPNQKRDAAQKANDILASMSGYLGSGEVPLPPMELPAVEPDNLPVFEALPTPTPEPAPANIIPLPAPTRADATVPAWRRRFYPRPRNSSDFPPPPGYGGQALSWPM